MKQAHVHDFKPKDEKVLVAQYRVEDGKTKYINTTGADILKQRVCKCGKVETFDLKRQKT